MTKEGRGAPLREPPWPDFIPIKCFSIRHQNCVPQICFWTRDRKNTQRDVNVGQLNDPVSKEISDAF